MRTLAALAAALAMTASCASPRPPSSTPPPVAAGRVVDSGPAGYRELLSRWDDRPLVVNFWASWCVPCVDEMPLLVAAAGEHEDRVRFLGIDVQDDASSAEAFIERFSIPFAHIGDPRKEIMGAQRIVGLPATRFYHAGGEVAFTVQGQLDRPSLEARLAELVASARPPPSP